MFKQAIVLFAMTMSLMSAYAEKGTDTFVLVKGGTFKNLASNYFGKDVKVPDFYIGRYEVTQKEWSEVMGSNPSEFKGDDMPVEKVSWYDCVEYCNKRSEKEGLKPCYNIDKDKRDPVNTNDIDTIKWTVTVNKDADGYRLPTETEWEYAASGGQLSKSCLYSGGNDIDKVAWYWKNSGDSALKGNWAWPMIKGNHCRPKPVGSKLPNELGLYDMSGNVREWCWDWYDSDGTEPIGRSWRGGGWFSGDQFCSVSFRGNFEASGKGPDQGFRLCRSAKTKPKESD